ncbi:DUF2306 domain-containing protein [Amycolatopsis nigrescens]|uniref:DUF2306 domain-containing protein n=1 Tax=Amycolatopsis nigrescens TaxID=381445 RepID=UPI00037D3321|nr:DUF2306 domain-containing protein [Amycolatopsis nigrescens]
MVPLAFVVLAFLAFSLPPYLGLDVRASRVPPPPGLGWYYPMLVAHVGFATVAMVSSVLQIWPWFRQKYPVAHRRIGRVYVLAGVLPSGVAGLAVAVASPFGPVAAVSNTMLALLWLTFTITGFRMARARRFGEHRKWMIRSFALTMSIISNRIWAVVWAIALAPQLDTTFGGNEQAYIVAVSGLTTWTGWVLPLLVAQWWLERGKRRTRTPKPVTQPAPS